MKGDLNDLPSDNTSSGSMLRKEIRAVIRRYGQESDITAYQAIGCLEVVKQDILSMMSKEAE